METHSTEHIRKTLENEGYILLSGYKGAHQKIEARCPMGHTWGFTWGGFSQGSRCRFCAIEERAKDRRTDIKDIRKLLEKEGYKLISAEYGGPNKKLEAICPNGHCYSFQWYRFTKGIRCGKCAFNVPRTYEEVKRLIEREGFILLSTEYKGSHGQLEVQCPQGHKYEVLWTNFQQGYRCPQCMYNSHRLTLEDIRKGFEQEGYKLLSTEYVNTQSVLEYECPKGHKNKMKWYLFKVGHRCPDCYEWQGQKALKELLEKIYPGQVFGRTRPRFLEGLELDISIRGQNLAFEYDGQQHYFPVRFGGMTAQQAQINFKKQKMRDKKKDRLCKKNGYKLIRVKYNEPLTMENIQRKINEL